MDQAKFIVVYVTCPKEKAAELSQGLVTSALAACVNILPSIRSIYTWKGAVCDDEEALLIIKTQGSLFEKLRQKVLSLHPYEVPEIIAMPILSGHEPYLAWLEDTTSPKNSNP